MFPVLINVDISGTGQVFYRRTSDPSLLARATSEIRAPFNMSEDFEITDLFIATWDAVGYYARGTDKVNTTIEKTMRRILYLLCL